MFYSPRKPSFHHISYQAFQLLAHVGVSVLHAYKVLPGNTRLDAILTSDPLEARISESASSSSSRATRKDLACVASALRFCSDDSWFSAMVMACSSSPCRRFDSPTSSQAVVHGVAAPIACVASQQLADEINPSWIYSDPMTVGNDNMIPKPDHHAGNRPIPPPSCPIKVERMPHRPTLSPHFSPTPTVSPAMKKNVHGGGIQIGDSEMSGRQERSTTQSQR